MMLSRYVRNVIVSDSAGVSDHRLITAEVLLPLQIESFVRRTQLLEVRRHVVRVNSIVIRAIHIT